MVEITDIERHRRGMDRMNSRARADDLERRRLVARRNNIPIDEGGNMITDWEPTLNFGRHIAKDHLQRMVDRALDSGLTSRQLLSDESPGAARAH